MTASRWLVLSCVLALASVGALSQGSLIGWACWWVAGVAAWGLGVKRWLA